MKLLLITISFLSLLFGSVHVDSAKILLLPFAFPSHVSFFMNLGQGLTENGHSLYIGITDTYAKMEGLKKQNVTIITHTEKKETYLTMQSSMEEYLEHSMERTVIDDFRVNIPGSFESCENILEDKEFLKKLEAEKFDLVLVDAFQETRCYFIIPYLLDVPWASGYTIIEPWLSRNPSLPSAFPYMLGKPYTERMTFWERLDNIFAIVDFTAWPGVYNMDDNLVRKYAPNKPLVSLNTLAGRSVLWLIHSDLAIDYARPSMPNEVSVGGISTKPPKPLEKDLENFVSSAKTGVIVVSFGSISANLPKKFEDILMNTFKRLNQKVIMRYPYSPPENIPKNVKLMSWLPQNDLLGHKNVRIFITHCGASGQFEALYNGVPMIGMPLFGDQMYNAKRMAYLGYGIELSVPTVTEESLYKAINELWYNPSYLHRIEKASQIFRNQPMSPKERATYWLEHILKYGGEHLHTHALDMPWYQYLMLDIFAFLLVAIIIIVKLTVSFFKCMCCRKSVKTKKD